MILQIESLQPSYGNLAVQKSNAVRNIFYPIALHCHRLSHLDIVGDQMETILDFEEEEYDQGKAILIFSFVSHRPTDPIFREKSKNKINPDALSDKQTGYKKQMWSRLHFL